VNSLTAVFGSWRGGAPFTEGPQVRVVPMSRDSSGRNHMRAGRQSNWDNMVELVAARVGLRSCSGAADWDSRSGGKASRSQARPATGPALAFFRRRQCGGLPYERRRPSNGSDAAQPFLASWAPRYRDRTWREGEASFPPIGTLADGTRLPGVEGPIDCHSAPGRASAARLLPPGRPASAAGAEPSRPVRLRPKLWVPRREAAGLRRSSSRSGCVPLSASIY
jgi:hypothetical protein